MNVGVWIYPWDLQGPGRAETLDALRAGGVSEIRVALAYHPVTYPDPKTPGRLIAQPSDQVYFSWERADVGCGLYPLIDAVSKRQGDWVSALIADAHARAIRVTAWLVTFRNETLARRYPVAALLHAGGLAPSGLCLNRLETVTYASELIHAVAQWPLDQIVLESAGWVSPMDPGGAGPQSSIAKLSSVCSCFSCQEAYDLDQITAGETSGGLYASSWQRIARARETRVTRMWSELARIAHQAGKPLGVVGRWPASALEGYSHTGMAMVDFFTQLWYAENRQGELTAWQSLRPHLAESSTRAEVGIKFPQTRAEVPALAQDLLTNGVRTVMVYNASRVPRDHWAWLTELHSGPSPLR